MDEMINEYSQPNHQTEADQAGQQETFRFFVHILKNKRKLQARS